MKLDITQGERAHLLETQALSLDRKGNEVLIGLTREESEWYLKDQQNWLEQRSSGTRSKEDKARFLELSEKHERARLQGLGLTFTPPAGNA